MVGALEGRNEFGATERNAALVRVLSSGRMANVATCLRRDLQADGVVISEMGQGLVGTVYRLTFRLPPGAKIAVAQVAARLQVSISCV